MHATEVTTLVSRAVAETRGQKSACSNDVAFAVKFIAAYTAMAEVDEKAEAERKQ
jgi:hypothetical protein